MKIPDYTRPKATEVLEEVLKLAAEQPDHVYEPPTEEGSANIGGGACSYIRDASGATGTGCIVGQALIRLGFPLEVLSWVDRGWPVGRYDEVPEFITSVLDDWSYENPGDLHDSGIDGAGFVLLDIDDDVAYNRLKRIQTRQDSGHAWGVAVDAND